MSVINLHKDIIEELAFDPSVEAKNISVGVDNGVVTLSGHVSSYAEKIAAERAVKRVSGVQGVAEELKIDLPSFHIRNDTDLARSAVEAIRWNARIPMDSVVVKVERGWATLTGKVDWQYQREAARIAIASIAGMLGVTNQIMLNERVVAGNVDERIRESFLRNSEIDASQIKIKTSGGKVTLTGPVHSWTEREDAETAAYSVSGVLEVDNLTVIS